jgi:cell division protein FtsX
MNWVTIKRIFRAGFLDFWRNAFVSFASILVMTVTLFVVGTAIFAGVMLNFTISRAAQQGRRQRLLYHRRPRTASLTLKSALEALPRGGSVEYMSRDEALAQFRERYKTTSWRSRRSRSWATTRSAQFAQDQRHAGGTAAS